MSRTLEPIKSENVQNFGYWGMYGESLLRKITKVIVRLHQNMNPFFPAITLEEQDEELDDLIFHMQELRDLAVLDVLLCNWA